MFTSAIWTSHKKVPPKKVLEKCQGITYGTVALKLLYPALSNV